MDQLPTILVIALVVLILAWIFQRMTTKRCPTCRVRMRLLTEGVGKTQKFECPRCKKRLSTGVPTGKGRR
jgi:tRNA(Ile2) C34 agmatinyltransferase TiaS